MWKDGIITTDEGEVIARPGMTADEVRSTRFALGGKFWQNPESVRHQHIQEAPFRIRDNNCIGHAYFLDGRLVFFGFILSQEEAKLRFGTTQPGPDSEELKFYQAWVEQEVGSRPPVNFPWGRIGADYNYKTMSCDIYLKYSHT